MRNIDDQMLGSFVDGQLDEVNRGLVLEAMESDPAVRERVYRLRRAKDLMKLGFGDVRAPARALPEIKVRRWRLDSLGVAASLLILLAGFVGGYLGYQGGTYLTGRSAAAGGSVVRPQADRVLLHVSESDPKQFAAVLDYIRKFLEKYEKSGGEVAVVANAGGLDLMRVGVSPFEDQIIALMRDHKNVHFIACAASIGELRKKGVEPVIIRKIDHSLPALDQIVRHVQDGWTYVKVKSLVDT